MAKWTLKQLKSIREGDLLSIVCSKCDTSSHESIKNNEMIRTYEFVLVYSEPEIRSLRDFRIVIDWMKGTVCGVFSPSYSCGFPDSIGLDALEAIYHTERPKSPPKTYLAKSPAKRKPREDKQTQGWVSVIRKM